MIQILSSAVYAILLFVSILFCLRFGWKMGRRQFEALGESGVSGFGVVDGAVFGLMGLLIAFTFNGAAGRFEARRDLMTNQINAIGTAYLRLDLLENPAERAELQELFRRHVDGFLDITKCASNPKGVQAATARLDTVNRDLWAKTVAAVKTDHTQPLGVILIPAVNEMLDLCTASLLAARRHTPLVVHALVGILVLASSVLAGFEMARANRPSRLHAVAFALITAFSIYFILDLEYPRVGFVRVDAFDHGLVELRATMN